VVGCREGPGQSAADEWGAAGDAFCAPGLFVDEDCGGDRAFVSLFGRIRR